MNEAHLTYRVINLRKVIAKRDPLRTLGTFYEQSGTTLNSKKDFLRFYATSCLKDYDAGGYVPGEVCDWGEATSTHPARSTVTISLLPPFEREREGQIQI